MTLLIRQLFVVYLFLFYSYFYFIVDEEFMIFIVIFIWLLFFSFFYFRNIKLFFEDNVQNLVNEYFFFHNRRNLYLSIIRDQYFDFIFLNKNINSLILLLITNINKNINKSLFLDFKKFFVLKLEYLNLYKKYLKNILMVFKLSFLTFFYKLTNFLLIKLNSLLNSFFSYLPKSSIIYLPFKKSNRAPRRKVSSNIKNRNKSKKKILNSSFVFNQIFLFKMKKIKRTNVKFKKRVIKMFRLLFLLRVLKRKLLKRKLMNLKRKNVYYKVNNNINIGVKGK
jgi:hypothetical protein